jgi:hypothetical protein
VADLIRRVELYDVLGHQRWAERSKKPRLTVGAYLDTGAGRTIISTRLSRAVKMIDVPSYRIQYTVPIHQVAKTMMTGLRMVSPGCREPVPMLVAVSDEIIQKLELPGVEMLVGQDYLQAARVRLDLAPGGERETVACRAPPKGRLERYYGE